jgi:adenylate cyclase
MPPAPPPSPTRVEERRLILGVVDLVGFTVACRTLTPTAVFRALEALYRHVAAEVEAAGGRVVKVMGDAVLVVFPADDPAPALGALRRLAAGPCPPFAPSTAPARLQVKAHVGLVASGPLGPPGDCRFDVVGAAVNELFLLPAGDLVLSPELLRLTGPAGT